MSKLTVFLALTAVAAYLLGGINGSIITSLNFFKKDVRHYGSGNAGLTNFARTFGSDGLVVVLLVDALKTIAAILLGGWLVGMAEQPMLGRIFAGFFAMLGHVWPVYYRFHGGKAVLCAGTMVWMIDWRIALLCWAVFLVVVIFSKYVSLGSVSSALFFPVGLLAFGYTGTEALLGLLCALLLIFAHRENIRRLRAGTESKLKFGGRPKNR